MRKQIIVGMCAVGLLMSPAALAQPDLEGGPIPAIKEAPGVLDGTYIEQHVPLKKPIPYDYLREADAVWTKRVWRSIDLRERQNHPLYFPLEEKRSILNIQTGAEDYRTFENSRQWSLWRVIKYHAFDKLLQGKTPDLTVFYTSYENQASFPQDGDGFKYPVVPQSGNYRDSSYIQSVAGLFNQIQFGAMVEQYDGDGNLMYDLDPASPNYGQPLMKQEPDKYIPITSEDIVRYDIKEEWFFDKERSVLDVRILGIAPVVMEKENGKPTGKSKRLFWLYFPECRNVFVRYFVFNARNDAMRMSYDDVFWKRQFASYITKENNVYDREINDYKLGVDALLESERIKEEVFLFEHDVWHF